MMNMPDIAFAGKMASGKDTAARRFIERLGYTKLALADAVKREYAASLGITVQEVEANKGKHRTGLQELGHGRRQEDPEYWLRAWEDARLRIRGPVICTDVRYMNEAHHFINRGTFLVRIVVPDEVRLGRLKSLYGTVTQEQLNHPSERDIDSMPVHCQLSGNLHPDMIIPTLANVYERLLKSAPAR